MSAYYCTSLGKLKILQSGGDGYITIIVRKLLWLDLERRRNWTWRYKISTFESLAKNKIYHY